NCRKMEANVWTDPNVAELLRGEFVMIELFVDDRTKLDESEVYVSEFSGKTINTLGKKWSDLQADRFESNSQPLYAILDGDGNLLIPPSGADYEPVSYANYLKKGIETFKAQN